MYNFKPCDWKSLENKEIALLPTIDQPQFHPRKRKPGILELRKKVFSIENLNSWRNAESIDIYFVYVWLRNKGHRCISDKKKLKSLKNDVFL